ncbi:MAG: hypothetical protein PSY14_06855 [bacterium]|nr:hypothetical protein [bacterium]
MKPTVIIFAFAAALSLTACVNRAPQANDCEVIHKGKPAAIEACLQERRHNFWSFL